MPHPAFNLYYYSKISKNALFITAWTKTGMRSYGGFYSTIVTESMLTPVTIVINFYEKE